MKIAISSKGSRLDDDLDLRFGRAKGFIIYDLATDTFNFIDNIDNINATQGAGIQAAQTIIDNNIDALITGYCGPKAYKVLKAVDVPIYTAKLDKISNIIKQFKNNELSEQSDSI